MASMALYNTKKALNELRTIERFCFCLHINTILEGEGGCWSLGGEVQRDQSQTQTNVRFLDVNRPLQTLTLSVRPISIANRKIFSPLTLSIYIINICHSFIKLFVLPSPFDPLLLTCDMFAIDDLQNKTNLVDLEVATINQIIEKHTRSDSWK